MKPVQTALDAERQKSTRLEAELEAVKRNNASLASTCVAGCLLRCCDGDCHRWSHVVLFILYLSGATPFSSYTISSSGPINHRSFQGGQLGGR